MALAVVPSLVAMRYRGRGYRGSPGQRGSGDEGRRGVGIGEARDEGAGGQGKEGRGWKASAAGTAGRGGSRGPACQSESTSKNQKSGLEERVEVGRRHRWQKPELYVEKGRSEIAYSYDCKSLFSKRNLKFFGVRLFAPISRQSYAFARSRYVTREVCTKRARVTVGGRGGRRRPRRRCAWRDRAGGTR